ncbi:hypothetical protein Q9966_012075, partial [Columba livia]
MAEKMPARERVTASRSRGDKSRPPAAPPARADTVAGRLSQAEWLSLLRAERDDRDAGDVVAELLERVLAECSRAHAVRQRVPFTVGQARDAILQITECRFLARDEGDTEPEGPAGDSGWREDEEPEPCVADSWAQGFVPVLRLCRDEVSGAQSPCQGGRQDPPAAAEPGAPPAQPPCPGGVSSAATVLPAPGPCPEPLPDRA